MSSKIDEIGTFVGRRIHLQAYWIWIAVYRKTKQVLGFVAGNREAETLEELWAYLVKIGVRGPIHTDGYSVYSKAILKSQHIQHMYDGGTNLAEGLNTRWSVVCRTRASASAAKRPSKRGCATKTPKFKRVSKQKASQPQVRGRK